VRPSVLIIGSEAVPFAKSGGLGDVLGALPSALAQLEWDVTLAMPKYRGIAAGKVSDRFSLQMGSVPFDVRIHE
jgi:starch synthase